MKTDANGGASAHRPTEAQDKLEGRLSSRFAVELGRAEQDYPALREKLAGAATSHRGRGPWPRLALPVTAAAALAVAVLIVGSLWFASPTRPGVEPAPATSAASAMALTMGSDGIPILLDGQRVYRPGDQSEWQTLSGSFLLGGYPAIVPCPFLPLPTAQADLAGCSLTLGSGPGGASGRKLAPRGSDVLGPWLDGSAIVVRVHTRDAESAQCTPDARAECEAGVVVEAVVWPAVPTQIAGERVYRAVDQASFPTTGSFLLGGPVTAPDVDPLCPNQVAQSTGDAARLDLLPTCRFQSVDGVQVAPKSVGLRDFRGRIVVVRVHAGDSEAALCPVEIDIECKAALVVEAVVWSGDQLVASGSPTPSASPTPSTSPTPSPALPAATYAVGPDGVPTMLNGETVYRAANLPTVPTFLLGGKLTRDTACAAPAAPLAKPPACGYWMIDGVTVGTAVEMNVAAIDQIVVVQVSRGRVLAVCPGGSCTRDTFVVTQIVWPNLEPPKVP